MNDRQQEYDPQRWVLLIVFKLLFIGIAAAHPAPRLDESMKKPMSTLPALKSADWVRNAVIYSVYLRSFSPEGTFAGLEKRLPALKELGVTVLWLMPIHPVGVIKRKGSLGSPYSVQDYYAVNPEFGTMGDFKRLVKSVHRQKMKLIIDLVVNHTSWDSKLIKEHPGWFTKDAKGNIVSPNGDWTDVADLDYRQAGLRTYILDMMVWWVKKIGIDGFRCDVSEMVPTDFWEDARDRLNAIKPVMMLSEGSIPEHHLKAFDLTYSWNVYDILKPLLDGKLAPKRLDTLLHNEAEQFPKGSLRMRFNTNHDKNAWEAPAVTRYGSDGLPLTAVLINTIPGVPLMYTGEEVANDKKLSLFEKIDVDWNRPRDMEQLYKKLFHLRKAHSSLSRGTFTRLPSSGDGAVYAFVRTDGRDRILTILNFAADSSSATLTFPQEIVGRTRRRIELKEIFTHTKLAITPPAPMTIRLEGHGYRVFIMQENKSR